MPTFTYTQNIPATNNDPSTDQPNMEVNNNSIYGILDVDMIGFNNINGGWHDWVTFVDQGSDPGSAAQQVREYSKFVGGTSSELFIQRDGVTAPVQLTSGIPVLGSTSGPVSAGVTYLSSQTFLAGSMFISSGTIVNAGGTKTIAITFASLGLSPFPTNFTSYSYEVKSLTSSSNIASVSSTGFNAVFTTNDTIYWQIIGY